MKTVPFLKKTTIVPENLVGTKWIGWSDFIRDRMTLEFVDKTKCIFTSKPNKYPITYIVNENNIVFSNVDDTFELRGNILFSGDIPTFVKAA